LTISKIGRKYDSGPEKSPVLLENGTNELEIIEFLLGDQRFAINVMKVREIVTPLPITKIPHSHPYMEGIIELRGEVLPVVDLAKALCFPASAHPEHDKFIVAEFNKQKIVFRVHNVTRIYRISWTQIEKPSQISKPLEYWLEMADQALYAAKQQGGNCITVAKPVDERC
jgi:two-component system, chemotaxis family, chemotaxis protein CheV